MNGQQLIAADLLAAAVSSAAWLGTAATLAGGRSRLARALLAVALLATLGRVAAVVALAGHGWWFVQDKVTVALPLMVVAAVAAGVAAVTRGPAKAVVPLFMAGYAGVAGVIFQFLFGYPMSLPQAMASVALVGVATALTWRMVNPSGGRRVLTLAASVAVAVGLAGAGLGFVPTARVDAGGGPHTTHDHHTVPVTDLRGPEQPAPGATVKRYALTARQAEITLASGRKVSAWTFNGQADGGASSRSAAQQTESGDSPLSAPGPALTATEGDLVEVTLTNVDIPDGVTLHWHGYDVRNGEDGAPGVTQDAVAVGERFVYRFLANQVGTYWYHTHQVSDLGVRMGLYGTLIVHPRTPSPSTMDIVAAVHTFGGALAVGTHDGMDSRRIEPGTPVRLRLINTDSTPHRFTLAGTAFKVVAVDGNDLSGPSEVGGVALRVAAGARYDVAFTMPSGPVSLRVDDLAVGLALSGDDGTDTSGWPELDLLTYGVPSKTEGFDGKPDRDFTLVLDRGLSMVDGKPAYAHTINGRAFPGVPTQVVRAGELVAFTVVNRGLETHPWHLHGHRVLVLAKDGRPVSGSPLLLDTFDVQPGEVWRVAFRASNPGVWMNHCHNLTHADQGMALHLAYEGITTPFHGGHGG